MKSFSLSVSNQYKKLTMIDCHCHLQLFRNEEVQSIMSNISKMCIVKFLFTNSTNKNDFNNNSLLSSLYKNIFPSYGIHPWYLKEIYNIYTSINEGSDEEKLSGIMNEFNIEIEDRLIKKQKFGIGEIGIDALFPIKDVPIEFQMKVFLYQLEIAERNSLLVSIHCVRAWDKLYKLLDEFYKKSNTKNLIDKKLILLHSYCGTKQETKKFLKFNCWFSISPGMISSRNLNMIKELNINHILLESDSPSMFNKGIYHNDEELAELDLYYFKESLSQCCDNEGTIEHDSKIKYKNNPISIILLSKRLSEIMNMDHCDFLNKISTNNNNLLNSISISNNFNNE